MPSEFSNILYKAIIKKWGAQARYPYGELVGPIGELGQISVETNALLCDNNVTWNDFSDDVMSCLPSMVRL